jgi:hypothetical protein
MRFSHGFISVYLTFSFVFTAGVFAQQGGGIDSEELSNLPNVNFVNYTGPHAVVSSREDIWRIGHDLGLQIRAGNNNAGEANRYSVAHYIEGSPSTGVKGERLDADVFYLGPNVGVDHIRNLRVIIQGFLQGAYDYSAPDALVIARYITIYNAVYRGNWKYLTGRYKAGTLGGLSETAAGLALRYNEWPGKSQIIIPLQTAKPGSLNAVSTTPISEAPVINDMREKQKDMGVQDRQNMVQLKERQAQEAQNQAVQQKKEASQEEKNIAKERQNIAEERKQLEKAKVAAAQPQPTKPPANAAPQPGASPAPAASASKAPAEPKTPAQIAQAEKSLDQKEAALNKKETAVEEKKAEAAKNEQFAQAKKEEAQADRKEIAKDQNILLGKKPVPENLAGAIIGVTLLGSDSDEGMLALVNPQSGEVVKTGGVTIRARTLVTMKDGRIFAVAGDTAGQNHVIRLVEIDPATLDTKAQGGDDIAGTSLIWQDNGSLYALLAKDKAFYMGRFGPDLKKAAESAKPVHQWAAASFQNGKLLTQGADGKPLVLDPQTLQ